MPEVAELLQCLIYLICPIFSDTFCISQTSNDTDADEVVSVFDDHQVMGPSWHSECGGRIQQHRHRVLHRCSPHVYSSLCRTKDNISSCHWHCNRSNLTVWGFCWQNLPHSDISSLPKAGSWWTGNTPYPRVWCWRFASLALFGPQLVNVDLHVLWCIYLKVKPSLFLRVQTNVTENCLWYRVELAILSSTDEENLWCL